MQVLPLADGNSAEPSNFGNFYELYAIAAAVLGGCSLRGGEGSIVGVIVGTALIRLVLNANTMLGIPSQLEPAIAGFVILAAVTSRVSEDPGGDEYVLTEKEWVAASLPKPSMVKAGKVVTIDQPFTVASRVPGGGRQRTEAGLPGRPWQRAVRRRDARGSRHPVVGAAGGSLADRYGPGPPGGVITSVGRPRGRRSPRRPPRASHR